MKATLLVVTASFISVSAYGAQVSFDLRKAIAVGEDCAAEDLSRATSQLRVLTSAKAITVVTKAISLDLSSRGEALAARKVCTIRVPAKVSLGYTIKSVTQRATYGVYKTDGATLALSFRAAAIGSGTTLAKSFSRDASVNQPLTSAVSKTELSAAEQASLCSESEFIQKIDLSASGQVLDFSSLASIGRAGSDDVKLDVSLELVRCPSIR